MDKKTRQEVVRKLAKEYKQVSKKQKGVLLSQLIGITGYNRCYARWILSHVPKQKNREDRKDLHITVFFRNLKYSGKQAPTVVVNCWLQQYNSFFLL